MVQKVLHPFIQSIVQHFPAPDEDGDKYHRVISEWVEGVTLEGKLRGGAMKEEEAIRIFAKVALALEQTHQ